MTSAELNPQQHAAVTHTGGPCLVLAGAGSGKTRVITQRIAWLIRSGADPSSIAAVTFTNKAAAEMRERVAELLGAEPRGLWLMTFHALGLRLLREAAGRSGAPPSGFAILDRGQSLSVWKQCQSELRISVEDYPPQKLFESCSRAVNALEDPRAWDEPGQPIERRHAARVFTAYRRAMRERNALDFDDLLLRPLELLAADPEWRRRIAGRFRHLLVDEYQDTNQIQYRLLRELGSGGAAIMVVGDEDQSIYRWRGADISNVLDFRADFPDATIIRLEQNYRSTAPILRVAESLIAHNTERIGKRLWTEHASGTQPLHMLLSSERAEATWVSKRIAAAFAAGVPASDIAVLYRVNAQSRPFEEELSGRGIAYRVIGGPTFFRRAEVRDAISALRLLVAEDDTALARVVATPRRGVGPVALTALGSGDQGAAAALFAAMDEEDPAGALRDLGIAPRAAGALAELGHAIAGVRARLGEESLGELITTLLEETGYLPALRTARDGEERLANLDELIASAAEFGGNDKSSADRLLAFLDRTALISDVDATASAQGAVNLMTVHAAKGLEFHTVFVVGLEERLFPHASAMQEGQIEEERRLLYVAMTRARRELFLSSARLRRLHGQERLQSPSRFLSEIEPGALRVEREPGLVAGAQAPGERGPQRGRYRPGTATPKRSVAAKPVDPAAKGTGVEAAPESLGPGTAVYHPMFGPGRVTAAQGSGDQLKLTVVFARAGRKELVARFAKLQLLA